MRKLFAGAVLLSASLFSASSASAGTVLTFEGAGSLASLNDFYNGGSDSTGQTGTNYGVRFSSNSLSLIDAAAGGSGNTGNDPSGHTLLFFTSGGEATLNVAEGFSKSLSLFYTSYGPGIVTIYDGLDGTGNILGTLNLVGNIGDTSPSFDVWSQSSVNFLGVAHSVDFSGSANHIGFDNISFGALGSVPEASTWAMMILGVGLAGTAMRRRKVRVSYAA